MDEIVILDGLEEMDGNEVDFVKGLVTSLFGPFHDEVFIDGVYFGERRYPHTVYRTPQNRFHLSICLPQHQAAEPLARLVHLSHELVHCLSPNGPPPKATILEEGLAEHSKIYLSRSLYENEYPGYDFRHLSAGEYRSAFDKIEELIGYEGLDRLRCGIRAVRSKTGLPFCRINEADLAEVFTKTPRLLLKELSKPFVG